MALPPPQVNPLKPGPAHRAQFVIEIVGPRSMPANLAAQLLRPEWHDSLGQPEIFVMSPSDKEWRPLTPQQAGSYDSLALCWDILAPRGALSSQAGGHLLQVAEQFASTVNRRAMPLPPPADLDKAVRGLSEEREQLDIGVSLMVLPAKGFVAERDLWIVCARLGLEFAPEGSFDWRAANHPSPLFGVTPIGSVDAFSLGAVQADARHDGVTIGFSVPRCPDPQVALEGGFHAADVIAQAITGTPFDDSARPLTQPIRDELRKDLLQGLQMLGQASLVPGSAAALRLFR